VKIKSPVEIDRELPFLQCIIFTDLGALAHHYLSILFIGNEEGPTSSMALSLARGSFRSVYGAV